MIMMYFKVMEIFKFKDSLFYYQGLFYVFLEDLRFEIFQARHDLPTIRPFGFITTIELIFRDYY